MTQAQAQSLVSFHAEQIAALAKGPAETVATMRADWRNEVLADKSLANAEGLLPEVRASIGRAIDSLGPQLAVPFREAMNLTGAGDHPAFVRAFAQFAKRLSEGRPVAAGGPAAVKSPNKASGPGASALFSTLPSAQS